MRPPRGSRPQPNLGPGGPFSRLDACPALQRRGMLLYLVFDACGAEVQGLERIFLIHSDPTTKPSDSLARGEARNRRVGCPTWGAPT